MLMPPEYLSVKFKVIKYDAVVYAVCMCIYSAET